MRTGNNKKSERYRIGDFILDAGLQQVLRDNQALELPRLSFDLLLELARAAPNVVMTDELIERVWNGAVVNPETVSKRVELIRNVLGDDSHKPTYIALVRGRGYRIIAPVEVCMRRSDVETPWWRNPVLLAAAVIVALLATGFFISRDGTQSSAKLLGQSVVVLPFRNLSGEDIEYKADGLTDALVSRLRKAPGIYVPAHTTTFVFKDSTEDPRNIGRKLKVDLVVEGSVELVDEQLQVRVNLFDVSSGTRVWSDSFRLEDDGSIFETLEIISEAVMEESQVTSPSEDLVSSRYGTADDIAFDHYLKGRYHYYRMHTDDLKKAVDHFQRAVGRDDQFLDAYAGIADAYAAMNMIGDLPAAQAVRSMRSAVRAAIEIAPDSAQAQASLARLRWLMGDTHGAMASLQVAINVNPDYLPARHQLIKILSDAEVPIRPEEAFENVKHALYLDPLNEVTNIQLAFMHWDAGHYAEGAAVLEALLAVRPDAASAARELSFAASSYGHGIEAIKRAYQSVKLNPGDLESWIAVGFAHGVLGDFEAAKEAFTAALDLAPDNPYVIDWMVNVYQTNTADHVTMRPVVQRYMQNQPHLGDTGQITIDTRRNLYVIGKAAALAGNNEVARDYLARAARLDTPLVYGYGDELILLCYLAVVHRRLDEPDKANAALDRAYNLHGGSVGLVSPEERESVGDDWRGWPIEPFLWAAVSALQNKNEQALFRLRLAERNGWPFYRQLEIEPTFESLRSDKRFQEIVARIRARTEKMREEAQALDLPSLPNVSVSSR